MRAQFGNPGDLPISVPLIRLTTALSPGQQRRAEQRGTDRGERCRARKALARARRFSPS
jgi:hypothetical protein